MQITIDRDLQDKLKNLNPFTSKDDLRPGLQGVWCYGGTMYATDGHKMKWHDHKLPEIVFFPSYFITKLKLKKDQSLQLRIKEAIEGYFVPVETSDKYMCLNRPNHASCIPSYGKGYTIEINDLLELERFCRAAKLIDNYKETMYFSIKDGTLTILTKKGRATLKMVTSVSKEGNALDEFKLHASRLYTCIRNLEENYIKIQAASQTKAFIINDNTLLMPVYF